MSHENIERTNTQLGIWGEGEEAQGRSFPSTNLLVEVWRIVVNVIHNDLESASLLKGFIKRCTVLGDHSQEELSVL